MSQTNRFGQIQTGWRSVTVLDTTGGNPDDVTEYLGPPAGTVIEVALQLPSGMTHATLSFYRYTAVGDVELFPEAATAALTGSGSHAVDVFASYTHRGDRVALGISAKSGSGAVADIKTMYRWS